MSNLFPTRNDLPAKTRTAIVEQLNHYLADLFDLYSQTKFAHWNVKGSTFYQLHKLFDELAEEVEGAVDEVAERITALGGVAHGTVRMSAKNSRLEEFPSGEHGCEAVVQIVADRFAATGKAVRAGIDEAAKTGDADSADLLTEISRMLDKSLYFLESHLQK